MESPGGVRPVKARLALGVLAGLAAALGLSGLALRFRPMWGPILAGLNDFPAFYFGSHLLASHQLYDPAAMLAKQLEVLGRSCDNIQYVRLPFFAALLWPLSQLPYPSAYAVWQLCSLGALIGFIRLWPAHRLTTFLMCCWFPPVAANFANGQDVTFLLLWMALGAWLAGRGSWFWAGLVLSLCAAKFHLFLFLPVVVVAGRFWRLGAGLTTGAAALVALSFAAGGLEWPVAFYRAVLNPAVHPELASFSLVGWLTSRLTGPALILAVLAMLLLTASAVWVCTRRMEFPMALSAAAAGGTLCAFHVYLQDYLLWLPLLALMVQSALQRPQPRPSPAPAGAA